MRKFILAGVLMLGATVPASALTIELNDIGGVQGTRALTGFRAAATYWESVFTNDITVNLDIGFAPLDEGVLGSTGSRIGIFAIEDVQNRIRATGTSTLDRAAVLPTLTGGALDVVTPGYADPLTQFGIDNSYQVYDTDGSFNNQAVALSSANAKALGYDIPAGTADGEIVFSSEFAFDFDPRNGIDTNGYDFIGVAIHEIGHALGFLSGADDYDYLGGPNGPLAAEYADYPVNDDFWGYALDLFRYGDNPNGFADGGPLLDWSPGTESYFSIDGGATSLAGFSTGSFNGDGYQASHWLANGTCANFVGIMNPYACNGTVDAVTALDLAAFDAIGYNVDVDVLADPGYAFTTAQTAVLAGVPEPGTWALLIAGFGMVGTAARRRRRYTTA